MDNVIIAAFGGQRHTRTRPAWLIDHGMILKFAGLDLPQSYEVHFSNTKYTPAKRVIGGPNGVVIPDEYFHNAERIYAWLYLHSGENDGYTAYEAEIPLIPRPETTNEPPTPEQEDIIEQAINALNDAVEDVEGAVEHYPKIENGYWYVWDADEDDFVNTGVKAEGEDGQDGAPGADGRDGADGTDGANGQDGADGQDGVSPTISSSSITGGHRLTIVDAGGTTTVDVMDGQDGAPGQDGADGAPGADGKDGADGAPGADGADGADGQDGVSPEVTIATITGGHSVTITDADHPTGQTFNVMDGTNGTNGTNGTDGDDGTTFTPAVSSAGVLSWTNDGGKQNPQSVDLVAAVLSALPTWTGGSF